MRSIVFKNKTNNRNQLQYIYFPHISATSISKLKKRISFRIKSNYRKHLTRVKSDFNA